MGMYLQMSCISFILVKKQQQSFTMLYNKVSSQLHNYGYVQIYQHIFSLQSPSSGQDHLYEIMPFLHDLNKENVHLLGLALGISQRRLNTKDVASFLREVIADWLNGVDMVNETSGQPSWRSLMSALRHPIVRQTGIANNIAVAKKLKF